MTIKEFSKIYNIDMSGIYKKIKRNKDKIENHIVVEEGIIHIDEVAQDFLLPRNKWIIQKAKNDIMSLEEKNKIEISAYRQKIEKLEKEITEIQEKYKNALRQIEELEELCVKEKQQTRKKFSLF